MINHNFTLEQAFYAYLIDILLLDVGVLEDLLDGLHCLPEEIDVEFLELGAGESLGEVVAILEAFNFDLGALLAGQGTLGLLNFTLELSESAQVLANVCAGLLLVGLDKELDDTVIEIFSSEMGITSGGKNLEDSLVDGEERDIESSTSEIVDDDLGFTTLLVKSIGDSGGGRLVDNTENL